VRIAASVLTKAALDRGSKDNVTVVIVDLRAPDAERRPDLSAAGGTTAPTPKSPPRPASAVVAGGSGGASATAQSPQMQTAQPHMPVASAGGDGAPTLQP
jgi:protein phosphatase 2C